MSRFRRCMLFNLRQLNLFAATLVFLLYSISILVFSFYFSVLTPDGSHENFRQAQKAETVYFVSAYKAEMVLEMAANFVANKPQREHEFPDRLDKPPITEKSSFIPRNRTLNIATGLSTVAKLLGITSDTLRYSATHYSRRKPSVTGLDDLLRLPRHDSSSGDLPISPHNFRYILNPVDLCTRGREPFLVAYVHTAPSHFRQRMNVRRSWGNGSCYDVSFRLVFFLGKTMQEGEQERVFAEANRYGDIVQEDFVDTYYNLTNKAVAALKWVSERCSQVTYVLKTDDDVFVNMFALLKILKERSYSPDNHTNSPNQPPYLPKRLKNASNTNSPKSLKSSPNNFKISPISLRNATNRAENSFNRPINSPNRPKGIILCSIQENAPVMRWGKWRIERDHWKDDLYPPFCSGAAYVMTSDVIAALYRESLSVPNYVIDDVYVTGFLANRLRHVTRIQISHFYALFRVKPLDDVTELEWREKILFYHSKSHGEYQSTWKRLVAIYA